MPVYRPTCELLIGGTDLSRKLVTAKVEDTITNKCPSFDFEISNPNNIYAGVDWLQYVYFSLNGERILMGRIEKPINTTVKGGARTLSISGRGDGGALMDISTNMHVKDAHPDDVLNKIIYKYALLKGSSDPNIGIGLNGLSGSLQFEFNWQKMPLWDMIEAISTASGAPSAFGGEGKFYDFRVSPFDVLDVFQAGSLSSGINLSGAVQWTERRQITDAFPIKTDIWVWGDELAGAIPLEMQPGYGYTTKVNTRSDPWTETNAGDFGFGNNIMQIYSENLKYIIGSYSIGIITKIPMGEGDPTDTAYWAMGFPFSYGNKWPGANFGGASGQDPSGGLNTYNMTDLTETMGEINAVGFFLRQGTADLGFTEDAVAFCIDVVDGSGTPCIIRSQKTTTGTHMTTTDWLYYQVSFGPSATIGTEEKQGKNYYIISTDKTKVFDWRNVAEIRFRIFIDGTVAEPKNVLVYFDGFRFIKPLVASYYTGGTRRVRFEDAAWLNHWYYAKNWAYALQDRVRVPQKYYELTNVGRTDIKAGYTFLLDGKTLVARSVTYKMDKDSGWIIDLDGWEAQ